jgi:hypothetical protein
VSSPLQRRKELLKKFKLFQRTNPKIKDFLLSPNCSKFHTLRYNEDLDLADCDLLNDVPFIIVLSGSVQIVCKKMLCQKPEQVYAQPCASPVKQCMEAPEDLEEPSSDEGAQPKVDWFNAHKVIRR